MILHLPYPVSTNCYWRNNSGRTHISEKGREFKTTAQRQYQWTTKLLRCDVELDITIFPKLNKKGAASKTLIDLDNCTKCVLDSLINVVYVDDKQVKKITLQYGEPKADGGTMVIVSTF